MFKKRIMFFILLILSFGILTSCSEEYIEYNLPNDNNYYYPWRNGSYRNPLLLGTRVKYEYTETHNVEIYYILQTPTVEEITAPTLINQLNALYQAM
jgi:hypothetical protein